MITLTYCSDLKVYKVKAYFEGHPELTRERTHSEDQIKTSGILSKFAEEAKANENKEIKVT